MGICTQGKRQRSRHGDCGDGRGRIAAGGGVPFPLHALTIGLPAGLSGDGGEESTLESARRELEEETGYSASSWTYLFTGPSSPGLTTEMVSFYLADGLRQVAEGGGVDNEDITVHRIPLFLVHDWLMDQTGQGKVVDPKIFMGLYFLFRRFNGSDREEG